MRKVRVAAAGLVALVCVAFPAVAGAHVEMSPGQAPAGKPVNLALEIGHGCDGAPTNRLVVQIPPQATDVKAKPIKGWKASTTASSLTWAGGPLPDHDELMFPFTATLSGKKGQTVSFKAIQKCEGGAETAWIEATKGGVEPEHPAPALTLTSSATAPAEEQQAEADQVAEEDAATTGEPTATAGDSDDSSSDDGGSDSKTILLIVVAGLAIGTIAGIIVRGRRKK